MRAAIVAGGQARRLGGRVKGLIEVDGAPIIDRLLGLLADLDPVIIGEPEGPYAGRARIIADTHPGSGAPGALRTALEHADDWVFVCASDLPWLDRRTVDRLWGARREGDLAVLAEAGGHLQPLAGWWHADALASVEGASLKAMAASVNARCVPFADPRPFYNINTPEELLRASDPA